MIMQVENGRAAALTALCVLALAACDPQPDPQRPDAPPPDASETAAPSSAQVSHGVEDDGVLPLAAALEEASAAPDPAPTRKRRRAPVTTVIEPQEPPVEVEGLVITGPRDGETLGEYRARADQAFRRIDVDGDGRLDREEVTSEVSRLSLRTALEQGDIDLDETVSPQEFGDLTTRAFQRLDADGNGVITDAEMDAGDPLASH